MTTKKCTTCGEVKLFTDFPTDRTKKNNLHSQCHICKNKRALIYKNTEEGYLKTMYNNISNREGRKCYVNFDELNAAFKKHKNTYGMKSAWGPGVDYLDQHLPITMITKMTNERKLTASNLSVDRLDSNLEYTLQNLIFIRCDENSRKKNTTYEDCKIHIRLHEERFINMKAI
tara:strand:+ start:52 stop:570 length:519 start_codon:yes stop_codon:yes gene_type:complete